MVPYKTGLDIGQLKGGPQKWCIQTKHVLIYGHFSI